jgi:hypothetical protein
MQFRLGVFMTSFEDLEIETSEIQKIGIRQFRQEISKQASAVPFAVTNHGRTIGYYIPVADSQVTQDLNSLKQALSRMSLLLKEQGISEDDIVNEFDKARRKK